jgi:tetratricopeptide (TPR) repeat protein
MITMLMACLPGGPSGISKDRPQNAPGADRKGPVEDGLIVGHRLMAAQEYELALRSYYLAASQHGVNADVLSAIGSANLRLGRLGQAEEILRRAVRMDPRFVPALNNLGVVLMEKREYGEARALFQQAFQIDSGQSDSIRENLRKAIARSETSLYPEAEDGQALDLLRVGSDGDFPLLSDL